MSLVVKQQNGILSQYLFSTIGLFYPALQGPFLSNNYRLSLPAAISSRVLAAS